MNNELIYASLEKVSEAIGDITPLFYEKFFKRSPESYELMIHMDDGVRGKMMEEVYRLVMIDDFNAEQEYLNWEINNHEVAYSVRPEMYDDLFSALKDVVIEGMGASWNAAFDEAWNEKISALLGEIKPRFSSLTA